MAVNTASEFSNSTLAQDIVNEGIEYHKKGELEKAATCYQQALAADAKNADAMHLMGMLLHQCGQTEQAIELIRVAIDSNPRAAVYHNNLATLLFEQANYAGASEALLNALQLKPDYTEAKFNLANSYRLMGELGLAEIFYLRILNRHPDLVSALGDLASIYLMQERFDDAITLLKDSLVKLIGDNKKNIQEMLLEAYVTKADKASNTGQKLDDLHNALAINCESELVLLALAECLAGSDNYSEAELAYRKVLEKNNNNAQVYYNLGIVLKKQGDYPSAIKAFDQALDLDTSFIDAAYNLGNVYKDDECLEDSLNAYLLALKVNPYHYGSLVNAGVVCGWLGRFEESLQFFKQAEQCEESNYVLLNNLGMVLQNLNRVEQANQYYEQALIANPSSNEVRWNYSLSLLLSGEYKKGWQYYESRWELPGNLKLEKRNYPQPQWNGEWLEDKTILVYSEQGFGDTLQFCRLLPELIKRGANVIFECPKALTKLIGTLHKDIEVVMPGESLPEFDFFSPLLSLTVRLEIDEKNIPLNLPYLKTSRNDGAKWERYLDYSERLNVGIVWAGNPRNSSLINNVVDQRRSCDPVYFSELFEIDGINFINLQKEFISNNFEGGCRIENPMPQCKDFYDTASLIQQLDLVITVDTAVAHLAGALNKPVWLLSRFDGCWRWLLDREDSPWYPSMKLFRQTSPGDWDGVFERVKAELQNRVSRQKVLH